MKEMMEAGVHFGHQTRLWNPRMKPYIYGARNGIHIIDLQKTVKMCEEACAFVSRLVSEGGDLLFVGTKKQAQPIVEEGARRCSMPFVTQRWLGGTLTNFKTIKGSIDRLSGLEKKMQEGGLTGLTKKERSQVDKEIAKLKRSLGGIQAMAELPAALFLMDPNREHIARHEALRLGVPIVALADTNCDPTGIDYLIPGNDDALKSIRYFTAKIADSCVEGVSLREAVMRQRLEGATAGTPIPTTREATVEGPGRAFVSRPEEYEKTVEGGYTAEQAESEAPGVPEDPTEKSTESK
jgi:small subunit ribosomal protein S2